MSIPNLSDNPEFDGIIEALARAVYDGKINKQQVPDELYFKTADKLLKAVHEGIGGSSFSFEDPRNSLLAHFQNNIFQFSAAKSEAQLIHINSLLVDANGNTRGFTEFRNLCLQSGYQFNINWLKTEYNTAVVAAQMAFQWDQLKDVEYLEYSTAGDERVRPAHAILEGFTAHHDDKVWDTIYPPNDWNCRCTVIPGLAENDGSKPIDVEGLKKHNTIPKLFQRNVGNTKTVLDADGYLKYQMATDQPKPSKLKLLTAEKNYGMPSIEQLYKRFEFEAPAVFDNKEMAKQWFKDQGGEFVIRDVNKVNVKFDKEFGDKIINKKSSEFRWEVIGNIKSILIEPDEIWSNLVNNKIERYYIKYFSTGPIVVSVNETRAFTTYELTRLDKFKKAKINITQLDKLRKGQLIYRMKLPQYNRPGV